jgi:hypothetical protein
MWAFMPSPPSSALPAMKGRSAERSPFRIIRKALLAFVMFAGTEVLGLKDATILA